MAIKPNVAYEYRMKFSNGKYTYYKRREGKKWYKITYKTYLNETGSAIGVSSDGSWHLEINGNDILGDK